MTFVTVNEIPKRERKKTHNDLEQMIEDFYMSDDDVCMVVCALEEYKNFTSAYQSIRFALKPYDGAIVIHAIGTDIYLEKVI